LEFNVPFEHKYGYIRDDYSSAKQMSARYYIMRHTSFKQSKQSECTRLKPGPSNKTTYVTRYVWPPNLSSDGATTRR